MSVLPGFKNFSLRQAFLLVIGGVYYEDPSSGPDPSSPRPEPWVSPSASFYDDAQLINIFFNVNRESQKSTKQKNPEKVKVPRVQTFGRETLREFAATR